MAGDYVYRQAVTGAAFTTRIFLYVGLLYVGLLYVPYRCIDNDDVSNIRIAH
jgi:hypothetical protein